MLKFTDTLVLRGTGISRILSGSKVRLGASSSPLRVNVRYGISLLPFNITGTCATNNPGLSVEIKQKLTSRMISLSNLRELFFFFFLFPSLGDTSSIAKCFHHIFQIQFWPKIFVTFFSMSILEY